MTRGALHHHFGDKRGLFEAVFAAEVERLASGLFDGVMGHSDHGLDELELGAGPLIDAFLEPRARAILLELGPAVLGQVQWRERLDPATLTLIEHALGHWAEAGLVALEEIRPLAVMFLGSAMAGVMEIAGSQGGAQETFRMARLLGETVRALRTARTAS